MTKIFTAIETAAKAHQGQFRKQTDIPYISHPVAVGFILQKNGFDETVVIAGILHDTLEDTPMTADDISRKFGEGVAQIVQGCSEDKSLSWEERKAHTHAMLRCCSYGIAAVTLADKLHNLTTILEEYRHVGDEVFERFRRGREKQQWYYFGILQALEENPILSGDLPILRDFRKTLHELFAVKQG